MYKTTSAFLDRLQYTHQRNGTWKAEFHGAFDIVTVADTLEHCRDQVQRSLDEEVAKMITAAPDKNAGKRRLKAN